MESVWETLKHFGDLVLALLGSFFSALAGVAMKHSHEAAQGIPWSWKRFALATPTITAMAVIGGGIGKWMEQSYNTPELLTWALTANLGYLGPEFVNKIAEIAEGRLKSGSLGKEEPKGDGGDA